MDITSKGIRYNTVQSDEWKLCHTTDYVKNFSGAFYGRDKDGHWLTTPTGKYSEPIPGFEVRITATRFPLYYINNFLLPVIIVSIAGLFAVFLPANSSDKINLAVAVLLSFFFLQGVVASLIPKSENAPFLAHYIIFALLLSAMNLSFSSVVVSIYNISGDVQMPKMIYFLGIRGLGHLLCMNLCERKESTIASGIAELLTSAGVLQNEENHDNLLGANALNNAQKVSFCVVPNELLHAEPNKWQDLAKILNRLLAILYTIASLSIAIAFLGPIAWAISDCESLSGA